MLDEYGDVDFVIVMLRSIIDKPHKKSSFVTLHDVATHYQNYSILYSSLIISWAICQSINQCIADNHNNIL